MSRGYRVFVDSFTALDDLKKKDHGDPDKVLDALRATNGRFSTFDIGTAKLAGTMDYLKRVGLIVYDNPQPRYPWCQVKLVEPMDETP